MDWSKALDLGRALTNVKHDLIGDWYRDPWGWPELDFVVDREPGTLVERARGTGVRRVANIDVPKENFATRPAIVMEPVDRLLYQAITDRVSNPVTRGISPWVFGWRLPRAKQVAGVMARNDREWELQRAALSFLVSMCNFGFKTDIVSCFASMPIAGVSEEIERRVGSGLVTDRLLDLLRGWDASPGRRGLPQRSMASAILANMYLTGLDQVINEYNSAEAERSSLGMLDSLSTRWMDDIWVFGQEESSLRRLQVDLQSAARDLELELNSAKTKLLEGDQLAEEALRANHSAVDDSLTEPFGPDVKPLEELIDQITFAPEEADRTSIHFAMVRMRRYEVISRLTSLVSVANRMPHGADHLSRAFRGFGSWKHLMSWYVDYLDSSWACFDWSAAQFATMFPSKAKVDAALINALQSRLANRPELPMFAVAIQRLIRWSPNELRDLVRDLEGTTDHPLERRMLGMAALALHEPRRRVRDLLGGYEENSVTLRMIEANDFKPFVVAADFG